MAFAWLKQTQPVDNNYGLINIVYKFLNHGSNDKVLGAHHHDKNDVDNNDNEGDFDDESVHIDNDDVDDDGNDDDVDDDVNDDNEEWKLL